MLLRFEMEFIRMKNGGCIRADAILAVLTAEARAADSLCAELKPRVIVHFGDGIYNNSIVLSCRNGRRVRRVVPIDYGADKGC